MCWNIAAVLDGMKASEPVHTTPEPSLISTPAHQTVVRSTELSAHHIFFVSWNFSIAPLNRHHITPWITKTLKSNLAFSSRALCIHTYACSDNCTTTTSVRKAHHLRNPARVLENGPWISQLELRESETISFLVTYIRFKSHFEFGPWLPFQKYFFSSIYTDIICFGLLQFYGILTSEIRKIIRSRIKVLQYTMYKNFPMCIFQLFK